MKRLYAAKLRQVSQHAQRSQRNLQLQLFKAQQEKNRLQEELDSLKNEKNQEAGATAKRTSPTLEETQWEVRPWRTDEAVYGSGKYLPDIRKNRQGTELFPCLFCLNGSNRVHKDSQTVLLLPPFIPIILPLRFARSQERSPCLSSN